MSTKTKPRPRKGTNDSGPPLAKSPARSKEPAVAIVEHSPAAVSEWRYLLPALALALAVFGQTVAFDFVNWDDDVNVLENRGVTNLDWGLIWTKQVIGNYNPLSISTFAIEYALVGTKAWLFHLDNLLLHGVCITLVYFLGRRLCLGPVAAGLLAALFAIHPMRVESVAWVTERKDVLFAAFYFGAMLLYERGRQNGRQGSWQWGVAALFVLALLSKIQAVSLPLSLVCLDYLRQRELRVSEVLAKAPYFLMSLAVGALGIYLLGENGSLEEATDYSFLDRLAVGAYAYTVYLVKAVAPYVHSPLYPYPSELPLQAYLSFGVVAAAVVLMVMGWRKGWVAVTFGLVLFSVNVVFMLQVLGAGQGYLADRFTYVGYVGLFWLMAYGFQRLTVRMPGVALRTGVGVYVVLLTALAFRQTRIWQNGDTLWAHVAEVFPNTATAYGNRGQWLWARDQPELAMALFTKAIEVDPSEGDYLNSRGKMHFDEGRSAEAIADYTEGIAREPALAELHINRGAAFAKTGDYAAAERDIAKGLELDPKDFNGYLNRSLLYYTVGRTNEALGDYDWMLRQRPERHDLWHERGTILLGLGRTTDGRADIATAIRRAPDEATAQRYRESIAH